MYKIFFFAFIIFISGFSQTIYAEDIESVLIDALKNYPDVEKSKLELKIKDKELLISKTDFLPSIEFSISQGKKISKSYPDTSNHGRNTLNPSTFDIDISQPLGTTKFLNYKQAKNTLTAEQFSNKATIQDILFRASNAYYSVLKDYFLLDVAVKNEQNLKQKLEATEKRFTFKDVTKTDVFQAKARYADAISKRIEAENNLEISLSEFLAIVGRKPNINWFSDNNKLITDSNPIDWKKFSELPKTPNSMKEAMIKALTGNPELNQLRYELSNSKINISKKKLDFAPEFSISGSLEKSFESSRTINKKDAYEVTAEMSMPIFNKGHNFYNLEKSRDSAISILKSIESKKINLKHEVKSSWKKIQSLKSSIKALEQSVESNEVALEGVIKEAGVGTQTTLNILDAQKELTEAEASLVNARFQLISSSFKLLKLCGLLNFSYFDIDY